MATRYPVKWSEYVVCLLPIGAVLFFLFYLILTGAYRKLEFRDTGKTPGDLVSVITSLGEFRNTGVMAVASKTSNEQAAIDENAKAEIQKMDSSIGAGDSVAWSSASALTLIVLLAATFIAGYVIWSSPRNMSVRKRWGLTGLCLVGAFGLLLVINYKTEFLDQSTVMIRQVVAVIQSHFVPKWWFSIEKTQRFFLVAGYGVAIFLIVATVFTVNPLPELSDKSKGSNKQGIDALEDASRYTAMQMKHLRAILYIGAVLLVIISFQQNVTLRWGLDYLQPPPSAKDVPGFASHTFLFQRLEILISNIVTGVGIMNTLLLAGLYVPAAWVLQRRALSLSWRAVQDGKPNRDDRKGNVPTKEQAEWMQRQGLTFPLKDQLPKIAAILSPLLAGPLGQLLNSLK